MNGFSQLARIVGHAPNYMHSVGRDAIVRYDGFGRRTSDSEPPLRKNVRRRFALRCREIVGIFRRFPYLHRLACRLSWVAQCSLSLHPIATWSCRCPHYLLLSHGLI